MSIALQINELRKNIPKNVRLVAVSKTHSAEQIKEAYDAGQLAFGENKAQELIAKQPLLPADIRWHFIGHLQTNKVKFLAPFVSMIESIDSLKLLKEVNKQAAKNDRVIDVLLQFHIAEEDTKFGLDLEEAKALLESNDFGSLKNIRVCGVMGMATFTEDKQHVKREFKHLKSIFDKLKADYFTSVDSFKEISMGMSGDYAEAIQEGASIVRIGSLIFGERTYSS